VNVVVRWLPASSLLAVVAMSLTGLISPPPPLAGAPAAEIAAYYAHHHIGLEIESLADCFGATFLVSADFFGPYASAMGGCSSFTYA